MGRMGGPRKRDAAASVPRAQELPGVLSWVQRCAALRQEKEKDRRTLKNSLLSIPYTGAGSQYWREFEPAQLRQFLTDLQNFLTRRQIVVSSIDLQI